MLIYLLLNKKYRQYEHLGKTGWGDINFPTQF